jgi:hypothetical protein
MAFEAGDRREIREGRKPAQKLHQFLSSGLPRSGMAVSPQHPGSSSFLVTIFERTSWFQSVDRRNPQKRTMTHNCLEYKDSRHSFTKSDDEPTSFTLVGN